MRYVDEFRNKTRIVQALEEIRAIMPEERINVMEVCGTHTMSFCKFGLDKLLPENLHLIAGPGCPVCVSTQGYIDSAISLSRNKDTLILTFGDMLRVPGSSSTLEKERSESGNVRVIYSPLDSLKIARLNPDKKVVFLGIGFETTAPTIGLSIDLAKKNNLKNLFFFSSLKLIPPAMELLVKDKRLKLDAFLCPGHVSAIIGTKPYQFIAKNYGLPCCVAGFEPLDILEGIYLILRQIVRKKPTVDNQYSRVVTKSGNLKAQKVMEKIFGVKDAYWRGLGKIPKSGLAIRKEYSYFDARKVFNIKQDGEDKKRKAKCRCADILKGLISPLACHLFAKACKLDTPVGPCMVSFEGACNAYYRYH